MSEHTGALVIIPLFLLLIAAIIVFGAWGYVGIAVDSAAYACARMGAATLDPGRGMNQAVWAARETLKGYYLDPAAAVIMVNGQWRRNGVVICRVKYTIDLSSMPFMNFLGIHSTEVRGGAAAGIAGWRSVWR